MQTLSDKQIEALQWIVEYGIAAKEKDLDDTNLDYSEDDADDERRLITLAREALTNITRDHTREEK